MAQAAGIPKLQAETSSNFSAGLVFTPTPGLTLSADGYHIDVNNRILHSGTFDQDMANAPRLAAALAAINADQARFFVNAANTRTT